jgi:phosphopantothenoylcysteine decarboxylase/phosphopantothenate--cysteine ligase
MQEAVTAELRTRRYDIVIAAAAAADWAVEKPYSYKVSTHKLKELDLKLRPTSKIIDSIKKISPKTFLVAFRAEYRLPMKDLIESAYARLLEAKADLIVVNDVGKKGAGFGTETNEVFIIDMQKKVIHVPLTHKRKVARRILDAAVEGIKLK